MYIITEKVKTEKSRLSSGVFSHVTDVATNITVSVSSKQKK